MPTMSSTNRGEQVAVAGHAQGEVGTVNSRLWPAKSQHGGQDGGDQAGGERGGQHPQHEQHGQEAGAASGRGPRPRPRSPMMATASRLWRSSPGPAVGRVRPGLRFSVSTSVISNPCACLARCCTRDRRQGGLRDLPSSNWDTCCCSAVSSRASATAGLEGQHPGPQLGGEGQRLLQLGERLPLLSMCTTSQGSCLRWAKRWP